MGRIEVADGAEREPDTTLEGGELSGGAILADDVTAVGVGCLAAALGILFPATVEFTGDFATHRDLDLIGFTATEGVTEEGAGGDGDFGARRGSGIVPAWRFVVAAGEGVDIGAVSGLDAELERAAATGLAGVTAFFSAECAMADDGRSALMAGVQTGASNTVGRATARGEMACMTRGRPSDRGEP